MALLVLIAVAISHHIKGYSAVRCDIRQHVGLGRGLLLLRSFFSRLVLVQQGKQNVLVSDQYVLERFLFGEEGGRKGNCIGMDPCEVVCLSGWRIPAAADNDSALRRWLVDGRAGGWSTNIGPSGAWTPWRPG